MRQIFLILEIIFIGFFASCAKRDNAKDPSIRVSPESLTVAANGGNYTLDVTMKCQAKSSVATDSCQLPG